MILRIFLLTCVTLSFAQAQDIQYVSAENGLVVREAPNRNSKRIALLDYGTSIEITEHTNVPLEIVDNGKKIDGKWVKIKGYIGDLYYEEGYVFSGYLTEDKLNKRFKIPFDEFTIYIEDLEAWQPERPINEKQKDSLTYTIELGDSPEGKIIKIKHHQEFRSIEVFQKHENSITIMGEGPHCDLIDYDHYYSSWKPLTVIAPNQAYKSLSYSSADWNKFVDVEMKDVISYVNNYCGEEWSKLIVKSKSVYDYPVGVSISKVYLRVVMTDIDGYKTEKIIIFDIPMGC